MERIAVHFGQGGKERESFPILTGRNGKEMLSEKNGQVNMYASMKGSMDQPSKLFLQDISRIYEVPSSATS